MTSGIMLRFAMSLKSFYGVFEDMEIPEKAVDGDRGPGGEIIYTMERRIKNKCIYFLPSPLIEIIKHFLNQQVM